MTGLRIWLRRSSVGRGFPALAALVVVLLMTGRGWGYEWNWAFSKASTSTILLSPLVAGMVAFDRSRLFTNTLQTVGETVMRPRIALVSMAAWLWACAIWSLSIATAAFVAHRGGASGRPDLWIFAQAPVALMAAACFGLAWGARVRGPLAGPAAALVVYLATVLLKGVGLPAVFWAGGATGTLIGVTQVPAIAATDIAINAAIAVTALAWHEEARTPARGGTRVMAAVLTIATISGAAAVATGLGGGDTYQESERKPICVGERTVVCGPPDGRAVLTIAESSLDTALQELGQSGIPWRQRYQLAAGRSVFDLSHEAGHLVVATEEIRRGKLARSDVASALATPRVCEAFLGAEPSDELLLKKQALVLAWVTDALERPETIRHAPSDVVEAFHALAGCEPQRSRQP